MLTIDPAFSAVGPRICASLRLVLNVIVGDILELGGLIQYTRGFYIET